MDYSKLCLKCMHERENEKCEHCGFDDNAYTLKPNAIAAPSVLKGRYLIGIPLGIGGFGITYIAFDLKVGGVCAIKEYMPDTVSYRNLVEQSVSVSESKLDGYRFGMKRFIEEAQMLMKFSKSKNIINVFDCFEENNTAYYVMEYLNGCDLRTFTNEFKIKMDFEFGLQCMYQVMNGLEELHSKDVIHRDVSPDNIYITKTGDVKILDFGAARYSLTQKERNLSVILKMGYAPLEQYSTKISQGPWTDIYALGATFYHLFSGVQLPEATERTLGENVKYLKDYNHLLPDYFCKVISKAISLQKNERYQSIAEMRADLLISQVQPYKESIFKKVSAENNDVSVASAANRNAVNKKATSRIAVNSDAAISNVNRNVINKKSDISSINLSNTLARKNIFGRRIMAYIIDLILAIIIALGFILSVGVVLEVMDMLDEVGVPIILSILFLTPVLLALLNSALESSKWKGTIGKKITGIQTINIYGGILSSNNSIKRNFLKLLSVILLLTEKNGLYLHEIISNSKVVEK